jgi:hypothetical protein
MTIEQEHMNLPIIPELILRLATAVVEAAVHLVEVVHLCHDQVEATNF